MGGSIAETGGTVKTITDHNRSPETSGFGAEGVSPGRAKAAGLRSGGRMKTYLSRSGRSGVRVNRVRIGVVVGKGVIEARFDDPVGGRGGAGSDANALLPQAEVTQDALDHGWTVDQRNNAQYSSSTHNYGQVGISCPGCVA